MNWPPPYMKTVCVCSFQSCFFLISQAQLRHTASWQTKEQLITGWGKYACAFVFCEKAESFRKNAHYCQDENIKWLKSSSAAYSLFCLMNQKTRARCQLPAGDKIILLQLRNTLLDHFSVYSIAASLRWSELQYEGLSSLVHIQHGATNHTAHQCSRSISFTPEDLSWFLARSLFHPHPVTAPVPVLSASESQRSLKY